MLKLLKHDLKRNWEYFIIFGIIILVSFIIFPFILNINYSFENQSSINSFLGLLTSFLVIILITTFVCFLSKSFRIIQKTLFEREAYLTFTLPYSNHKIIISKCLTIFIWYLFLSFCSFLGILIASYEAKALTGSEQLFLWFLQSDLDALSILYLFHSVFSIFLFIMIYLFSYSIVNTKLIKSKKKTWGGVFIILNIGVVSFLYNINLILFGKK